MYLFIYLFIYKSLHVICWQKEKCRIYLWPWNKHILHFLISQNGKWWTWPSGFYPLFHWCFIVSCFSELSNVKHALSLAAYHDIIMKVTLWIPHLCIKNIMSYCSTPSFLVPWIRCNIDVLNLFLSQASFQRSNSHDKVRKIVAEEGRAARNLIAWSVPLENKEEEG